MSRPRTRREFVRDLGIGAATMSLLGSLPSMGWARSKQTKQRLIIVFSPDGVVPSTFWPDKEGETFSFKESLKPLEPLRDRTLILHGVNDEIEGDGDNHMRGIGCLLTGTRLFSGNVQGGSDTPAGWAKGISIDQEIKNFLQRDPATRTRFGSLEFGVMVPDRADTWTRMCYAGPNKPLTPIDVPYQMFDKLYGQLEDRESLQSIADDLQREARALRDRLSSEDRKLLDEHAHWVREMERELQAAEQQDVGHPVPELEPGVHMENDNMPQISKMQIELLVNAFRADLTRVATLQYTNSVGQARMRWLGIDEGQHSLSHEPDSNEEAQESLTKINRWYCEQLASLAQKLDAIPEPGADGSMLDHTLIVWTNELGKGNSHTLNDIPFVLVGGAPGFKMGRSIKLSDVPHNRLLLSLAHGFGHHIETFGRREYCDDGPLNLS